MASKAKAGKVDVTNPRRLEKQDAWYYLPWNNDPCVEVYRQVRDVNGNPYTTSIRISAKKLLRELIAAGVKP